jgi:hypothetical protein
METRKEKSSPSTIELAYACKEVAMKSCEEESRQEPVYALGGALRDATSRRDGKPSIMDIVAMKRGYRPAVSE